MKTMTCRQLGGPCDLGHRGETADEVIKAQDKHLKEAVAAGDESHREARQEMKYRWLHPEAVAHLVQRRQGGLRGTARGLTTAVGRRQGAGRPTRAPRSRVGAGTTGALCGCPAPATQALPGPYPARGARGRDCALWTGAGRIIACARVGGGSAAPRVDRRYLHHQRHGKPGSIPR